MRSIAKFGKGDEKKEVIAVAQKWTNVASLSIQVSPLVSVAWGQDKPFNERLEYRNCTTTRNGRVPAGCVATAAAQIMSYWKYPTIIDNKTYSWAVLNNYKHWYDFYSSNSSANTSAIEMVSDLFQRIDEGVNMKYDCEGSGIETWRALKFLVDKGFTKGFTGNDYLISYNYASIRTALNAQRPLIARGCDYGLSNAERCHAWVIDGSAIFIASPATFFQLVHSNWGWNGLDNGYYFSGIFDPSEIVSGGLKFQNIEIGLVHR
jgi:hypothetical protein